MSPRTAQSIVLIVGLGLFAYTGIRDLLGTYGPGATFKQLWAIGAVTLLLMVAADLVPEIAGPFALLVGIAYVSAGQGVGDVLDRVSPKPASGTGSKPSAKGVRA